MDGAEIAISDAPGIGTYSTDGRKGSGTGDTWQSGVELSPEDKLRGAEYNEAKVINPVRF